MNSEPQFIYGWVPDLHTYCRECLFNYATHVETMKHDGSYRRYICKECVDKFQTRLATKLKQRSEPEQTKYKVTAHQARYESWVKRQKNAA